LDGSLLGDIDGSLLFFCRNDLRFVCCLLNRRRFILYGLIGQGIKAQLKLLQFLALLGNDLPLYLEFFLLFGN